MSIFNSFILYIIVLFISKTVLLRQLKMRTQTFLCFQYLYEFFFFWGEKTLKSTMHLPSHDSWLEWFSIHLFDFMNSQRDFKFLQMKGPIGSPKCNKAVATSLTYGTTSISYKQEPFQWCGGIMIAMNVKQFQG